MILVDLAGAERGPAGLRGVDHDLASDMVVTSRMAWSQVTIKGAAGPVAAQPG